MLGAAVGMTDAVAGMAVGAGAERQWVLLHGCAVVAGVVVVDAGTGAAAVRWWLLLRVWRVLLLVLLQL